MNDINSGPSCVVAVVALGLVSFEALFQLVFLQYSSLFVGWFSPAVALRTIGDSCRLASFHAALSSNM